MVTLFDVLEKAKSLPRADRVRLVQELNGELLKSEAVPFDNRLEPGRAYDVWSPHSAYDAASVLLAALATDASAS